MPILDNLAKAAKDFFLEEDHQAPAAPTLPVAPAPAPSSAPTAPAGQAAPAEPEPRHQEHLARLLAGNGKDFGAYTKLVQSMAASGLSGPLLYQTAFNAFAALTGQDLPALLSSAEQLEQTLLADQARVQQRHREKQGEAPNPKGPPSAIVQLLSQEQELQREVAELTEKLAARTQALQAAQQQLQEERHKARAALASYELAHTRALAELRRHRQAIGEMVR